MFLKAQAKRLLVIVILFVSFFDATLPVLATDTIIFGGGVNGGGAAISDLGGANINANTGNYAQIGITGNGNTITWPYMNVVQGNHLDFNFSANGQVALNNVINGISTFGGSLTSSGAAGRVIVSNPNGIIFENGSYTNCNALTLTTQNVNWDGQKFGQLTLTDNGSIAGIQIGQGNMNNAAVMRIAEDLNIVAHGIKVEGADILAGDNIRLITADGVTFLATTGEATNIANTNTNAVTYTATNAENNTVTSSILVKDSALAVKDNTNGKVYFITKGDSDKASIAAINSAIDGKTVLDVAGDADLEVIGNLFIDAGSYVGGDLISKTVDGTLHLTNTSASSSSIDYYNLLEYLINEGKISLADSTDEVKVKAALKATFGVTDEEVDLMIAFLGDQFQSVTTVTAHTTDTTYSGKGKLTIAGATVIGDVIAEGAGVEISNLTSSSLDVTSTAGSTSSSRNDVDTSTVDKMTKTWLADFSETTYPYVWNLDPNATGTLSVQINVGSILSPNWKTVSWVGGKWKDSNGTVYNLNLRISGGQYQAKNLLGYGVWKNVNWTTDSLGLSYWAFSSGSPVVDLVGNSQLATVYSPQPTTPATANGHIGDWIAVEDLANPINGTLIGGSFNAGTPTGPVSVPGENVVYNHSTSGSSTGDMVLSSITTTSGDLKATAVSDITINDSDIAGNLDAESLETAIHDVSTVSLPFVGVISTTTTDSSSRGKITINSTIVDGTATALANNVEVNGGSAGNYDLTAKVNSQTVSVDYPGTLLDSTTTTKTGGNITVNGAKTTGTVLSNLLADNQLTINNGSQFGNVRAFASEIDIMDSGIADAELTSGNNITISNATMGNVDAIAYNAGTISVTDSSANTLDLISEKVIGIYQFEDSGLDVLNQIADYLGLAIYETGRGNVIVADTTVVNGLNILANDVLVTDSTVGSLVAAAENKTLSMGSFSDFVDSNHKGKVVIDNVTTTTGNIEAYADNVSIANSYAANEIFVNELLVDPNDLLNGVTGNLSNIIAMLQGGSSNLDLSQLASLSGLSGLLNISTGNVVSITDTTAANKINVLGKDIVLTNVTAGDTISSYNTNLGLSTIVDQSILDTISDLFGSSDFVDSLLGISALSRNDITGANASNIYAGSFGDVNISNSVVSQNLYAVSLSNVNLSNINISNPAAAQSSNILAVGLDNATLSHVNGNNVVGISILEKTQVSDSLANNLVALGNNVEIGNTTNTGSALLAAYNDININNSNINQGLGLAGQNIQVNNSVVNSSALGAGHDINATNGSHINNSVAYAKNNVTLSNSTADKSLLIADVSVNANNGSNINNSIAYGQYVTLDGSTSDKSVLIAKENVNVNTGSHINNSIAYGKNVNINASTSDKSILAASNNVNILNGSNINSSIAYANNNVTLDGSTSDKSLLIAGESVNANNGSHVNNSIAYGKDVNFNASTSDKSILIASHDINATNGSHINNSVAYAKNNVTLSNSTADKSLLIADVSVNANNGSNINNSIAYGQYVTLDGSTSDKSVLIAKENVNVNTGSHINNSIAYGKNVNINASTSDKSILAASNNVNILNGSRITETLTMSKNANVKDSTVDRSIMLASNDITLNNSTSDKSILGAGRNVRATKGSAINSSVVMAGNDITLNNSTSDKSILGAGNNVNILNGSRITETLTMSKNANVKDSTVDRSIMLASNDITLNNSTSDKSILGAGNNVNILNGSKVDRSILAAGNNVNVRSNSELTNSLSYAGNDMNISDSKVRNVGAYAGNNLKAKNSDIKNFVSKSTNATFNNTQLDNAIVLADNNVNILNGSKVTDTLTLSKNASIRDSKVRDSVMLASNNISFNNSRVNNTLAVAGNDVSATNGTKIKQSALLAKHNVNLNDSTAERTLLAAGNNVNINNNSQVIDSAAYAGNNINMNNSKFISSRARAGNDINVKNGSKVADSKLKAERNVNVDNSKILSSLVKAGNDVNIINNSTVRNSKVKAGNDINIASSRFIRSRAKAGNDIKVSDNSTVKKSKLKAGNDVTIADSSIKDVRINAINDISITDTEAQGQLYANAENGNIDLTRVTGSADADLAGGDVTIISSVLADVLMDVRNDASIIDSTLDSVVIHSGNDTSITGSTIADVDINAVNNISISDSTINHSLNAIAENGDVTLTDLLGGANASLFGRDVTVDSSILGEVISYSNNNTNIVNSIFDFADISSANDVDITDSFVNTNIYIAADGDVALAGIYVGNDLNITSADSVLISNSDTPVSSDRPTILALANGMPPITDYNTDRFNNAYFNNIVAGSGTGTISYIGGNVNISNVNDARIINTGIVGDLNVSNVLTDTDLIRSYVGGDYNPGRDTIGGDASVFESYIKGAYQKYYNDDILLANDVDRQNYGNELDTIFRRQFSPRGFAAGDDKVKQLKSYTLSSIVKGKNNSIIVQKAFKAY